MCTSRNMYVAMTITYKSSCLWTNPIWSIEVCLSCWQLHSRTRVVISCHVRFKKWCMLMCRNIKTRTQVHSCTKCRNKNPSAYLVKYQIGILSNWKGSLYTFIKNIKGNIFYLLNLTNKAIEAKGADWNTLSMHS